MWQTCTESLNPLYCRDTIEYAAETRRCPSNCEKGLSLRTSISLIPTKRYINNEIDVLLFTSRIRRYPILRWSPSHSVRLFLRFSSWWCHNCAHRVLGCKWTLYVGTIQKTISYPITRNHVFVAHCFSRVLYSTYTVLRIMIRVIFGVFVESIVWA